MSETASFTDPVFLARFGLSRANVIDYFLHPMNPFRTSASTSNEVLAMQGVSIGILMQQGTMGYPLPPKIAEEEYAQALTRITGEQYELLPPEDESAYIQQSPLYTIRHVIRSNQTSIKVIGVYYIVEGVIYKSPSVRALMKATVSRTSSGLASASQALSSCARFHPSVGYTWIFEDDKKDMGPVELVNLTKQRKRRRIMDNRKPGERTPAEEEGIRASEAIDQILVRLSKSELVTGKK